MRVAAAIGLVAGLAAMTGLPAGPSAARAAAPIAQTPLPAPPVTPDGGGWALLTVLSFLALVLGLLTVRKRVRARSRLAARTSALTAGAPGIEPPGSEATPAAAMHEAADEIGRLGTRAVRALERRLTGVTDLRAAAAHAADVFHEALAGAPVGVWIHGPREALGAGLRSGGPGLVEQRGLIEQARREPVELDRVLAPWRDALSAGESVCIPDPAAEPDLCGRISLRAGSLALVPLPESVVLEGAIAIAWPSPGQIGSLELALAERLGAAAGHALERSRLQGELAERDRIARRRATGGVAAAPARERSTILVVDDQPTTTAFLADALVGEGHRVLVSGSGTEAMEFLARECVDVLLCSSELPDFSGWELARHGRELAGDLPILVMQATAADDEARRRGVEGVEVLPRPFRLEEALAAVSRALDGDLPRTRAA